jgi:CHAT domain-containing protein
MAKETKIKQLLESGALAQYKIIHFATHGAVAGGVSRASEPGLLLTPPNKASEADNGYLSASEIAALKLDAAWVILSACNTATWARRVLKRCRVSRAHSSMRVRVHCWCRTGRLVRTPPSSSLPR